MFYYFMKGMYILLSNEEFEGWEIWVLQEHDVSLLSYSSQMAPRCIFAII